VDDDLYTAGGIRCLEINLFSYWVALVLFLKNALELLGACGFEGLEVEVACSVLGSWTTGAAQPVVAVHAFIRACCPCFFHSAS
jgi:hypothetical protein